MRPVPNHIFDFTPETLREWCEAPPRRWPGFKAGQILEWVYKKHIVDPMAMTSLSKLERETLAREVAFLSGRVVREQTATDGTRKLLVEWEEGAGGGASVAAQRPVHAEAQGHESNGDRRIALLLPPTTGPQTECVMIPSVDPSGPRRTACVSSQVGCPVGCKFCASGLGGLEGNLSAGRIVEQVWRLGTARERISNVVFMGMGEPLANLPNVVRAVRTIAALWGLGISARKITISTVGLPQAIVKLAEQLELPVTLALSLHAPNDELRRQLIPWAQYTTIADLLAACRAWFEKTGREITLEYTLLRGVNDKPEHAVELAQVARTLRANVNLIRYNEVDGLEFRRPRDEDVREFQRLLVARNVNTHVRRSRGRDIAAACGQLRHEATTA
ncbi:MAG: 23S rRNA (adenine(2503)-C(2))-methyltransferase RlmN [Phycisphaerae bacterium]|nr:23S rRNA (adenine(2503)-C(2))-methyltransferase RlmN [Phycisphaerae bacterium]